MKQWNSSPFLQFVSGWPRLTFSHVMSDSLFGVFCQNYFVNTTMHRDWCQPRFLTQPNCHTRLPRVHLSFSMGCCGSPGHGRLPYISGALSHVIPYRYFGCICRKVWKLAEHLLLYGIISLATSHHSSYLTDSLAGNDGKTSIGFSRWWINPASGN